MTTGIARERKTEVYKEDSMKKQWLSLLLACLLLSMPTAACAEQTVMASATKTPINKVAAVTYDDVTRIVEAYLAVCKNKYWNKNLGSSAMKTAAYEDTITNAGCPTGGDKNLHYRNKKCTSNLFKGVGAVNDDNPSVFSETSSDAQCSGFASYMEYVIFRTQSTSKFKLCYGTGNHSLSNLANNEIKPGDQLRYNGHSYVIYKVDSSKAYFIQCNTSNADCKITTGSETLSSIRTKVGKCNGTTSGLFSSPAVKSISYTLYTYENYSGKNYLLNSDFSGDLDSYYWNSRDTAVATIGIDRETRHDGYNSLRIDNVSAGMKEGKKDLLFRAMTPKKAADGYINEDKSMIMSFWAKSSTNGAKMYFRWGYEDVYRSVTLTTDWAKYTVRMDRVSTFSEGVHPYVDRAGTVWLAEIQLEDGTTATDFVPENGGFNVSLNAKVGSTYSLPAAPSRPGYTFLGWYTSARGGSQITSSTSVKSGNLYVYAHWAGPAYSRSFTVAFDAGEGNCSIAEKMVTYHGTYGELPVPYRTGYRFLGWYMITEENDDLLITADSVMSKPENHTLYAQWEKIDLLELPSLTSVIEEEAFSGCAAEYILIPEDITQIGTRAFADCAQLEVIEFCANSVEIAADAFANCTELTIVAPAGGDIETFAADHNLTFVEKQVETLLPDV